MAALAAGYSTTASGVTLDRFCGSGITAANLAAATIMAGLEDVVIAGGTEMMSSYKQNAAKNRSPFLDNGNPQLTMCAAGGMAPAIIIERLSA